MPGAFGPASENFHLLEGSGEEFTNESREGCA
jgi:hypothetical protein